jgi:hypothetical protein
LFVDGFQRRRSFFLSSESHRRRRRASHLTRDRSTARRPHDFIAPSAFLRVHVAPRPSPLTSAHARPGRSASASPVHAPGAPRREREAAFVARAPTGRAELDRERVAGLLASREPRIEERPRGVSVGERRARHARARARWSLRDAMRARRGARALRGPPARVDAPRARPAPTRPASRGQVLRRRVRRRIRRVVVVFSRRVRQRRGRDEPGQLPTRGGAPA